MDRAKPMGPREYKKNRTEQLYKEEIWKERKKHNKNCKNLKGFTKWSHLSELHPEREEKKIFYQIHAFQLDIQLEGLDKVVI